MASFSSGCYLGVYSNEVSSFFGRFTRPLGLIVSFRGVLSGFRRGCGLRLAIQKCPGQRRAVPTLGQCHEASWLHKIFEGIIALTFGTHAPTVHVPNEVSVRLLIWAIGIDFSRLAIIFVPRTQSLQYPLIKEYTLSYDRNPSRIEGIFLNSTIHLKL